MNNMKNNTDWNKKIKTNFDNAANHYSYHSSIQKHFCYEIVLLIEKLSIKNGKWFDLGCGIGSLADEIEKQFPKKMFVELISVKRCLLTIKRIVKRFYGI